MKKNIKNKGLMLGIIMIFAAMTGATAIGKEILSVPDPDQSFVTLTETAYTGLTTCPSGHTGPTGGYYDYAKVTVISVFGTPMAGIPADYISFTVTPTDPQTQWYGTLSCTFTAVDPATNAQGEIRFRVVGDTSIAGNITIQAIVQGIQINDADILLCNSYDENTDGFIALQDLSFWQYDFTHTYDWRSDFNWDTYVALADLSMWQWHFVNG